MTGDRRGSPVPDVINKHVYNCTSTPDTPSANVSIKFEDFTINGTAILDTGSSDCIVPLSCVKKFRNKLLPSRQKIIGVSKKTLCPVGEFYADVHFVSDQPVFFKNIRFIVLENEVPILLGMSLLQHNTVSQCIFDKQQVQFKRKFIKSEVVQKIKLVNSAFKSTSPVNMVDNQTDNNENCRVPDTESKPSSGLNLKTVSEKVEWLKSNKNIVLPSSELDTTKYAQLVNLLVQYEDVLGTENSPLGQFKEMVRIPTKPGMARAVRQHAIAHQFRDVVSDEIQSMIDKKVIEPCADPKGFNSPVIVVSKQSGKPRVCANFRHTVNQILADEHDRWQMPFTDQEFQEIGLNNKYFAELDLKSSYWQCIIHPDDRYKTSFQWNNRVYQYCRLPFGLKMSGDIFARCISKALEDVTSENYKTYVDDILCYSACFKQYLLTLTQIFCTMRKHGIKLNAQKCKFLNNEAKFLGRIVNKDGYRPDSTYVADLKKLEAPKTKKQLQSVIGKFVWIRDFIETNVGENIANHCFSEIMHQMNKLNRKDIKKFHWTPEAQHAFDVAKSRLSSDRVIHFADFNATFTVTCDASAHAVGCAIMQQRNGKTVIIAVGSKTLTPTQQNWSTTEREGFALLWAIERFQYFLRGPTGFIVLSDHKALSFLDRTSFANPKIRRWQERLSEFNFVVEYIEGEKNQIADLLSRPFHPLKTVNADKDPGTIAGKFYKIDGTQLRVYVPSWVKTTFPISMLLANENDVKNSQVFLSAVAQPENNANIVFNELYGIKCKQHEEPALKQILTYLQNKVPYTKWQTDTTDHRRDMFHKLREQFFIEPKTGVLMITCNNRKCIVLPLTLRPYYLHLVHDLNGHFGRDRVLDFLKDLWWQGKRLDVENYLGSCVTCARRKGSYTQRNKPPILHLLRGTQPMDVVYCDFVHMPTGKTGKQYILTILDSYTRFVYAYPTVRDRACDAAKGLTTFMLEYGFPRILSSDRGTHFTSSVIKELCQNVQIKHNLHCAWRPQSSGNIERCHRVLKNALYATAHDLNLDWEECLPFIRRSMNNAKNISTGCSPHFLLFGREPNVTGLQLPSGTNTDPYSYGKHVRDTLIKADSMMKLANKEADLNMETRLNPKYEPPDINVGDQICINSEHRVEAHKSKLPWPGPFSVLKSNGSVIQLSTKNDETQWIHRYHCIKKVNRRQELDSDDMLLTNIFNPDGINYGEPNVDNTDRITQNPDVQSIVESSENAQIDDRNIDSDDQFQTPDASPELQRSSRKRICPTRFSPKMKGKSHD